MDVLNEIYNNQFLNAVAAAPTCQDGYYWDGVQCVPNSGSPTPTCPTGYTWNGSSCIQDAPTDTYFPPFDGGGCDFILRLDPNRPSYLMATGAEYRNQTGGAIATGIFAAITAIGSAVGSIFGAKEAAITAQTAEELAILKQLEKQKTTLYIIIGSIVLATVGISAYATIRYLKNKKS